MPIQGLKVKKGQPLVYIAILIFVIVLMVLLRHCSKVDNSVISKFGHQSGGDTIDVAIEYSPLSCYSYADTLGGFNYDLLRLISAYSHRPVKFHPVVTLAKSLKGLEMGSYDLLAAQFPVTAANKKRYLFTDAVFIDRQVLVQRRDGKGNVAVKSQLDLAGKTIYIVKGSPMGERIKSLSREIGDTIHIAVDDQYGPEQLFMRVATGEIKYAVINERIAQSLSPRYPKVDISTGISFSQFQSWALRKDNKALCDSINAWKRAVKTRPPYSARYNDLLQRYFGVKQ
jgi:membrane-bound lytic murein transglycosylase F